MGNRSIPFFDLKRQIAAHHDEFQGAWERVLRSGRFVSGNEVEAFEEKFRLYSGVNHAVACSSGTAALEFILRSWDIGPGDEVIVPANTWVSDAEVVVQLGATPVFADVADDSGLLTADTVRKCITHRTRAVIVVHMYGTFCPIGDIRTLADTHGFKILEDCAHAAGLFIHGRMAGSFGDAAAFSFYPTKNLGAFGDAGCVITDDAEAADTIRLLRDHGQTSRDVHIRIGTTGRMDEIQAAILTVKLEHLDEWNARRREIASQYLLAMKHSGVEPGFRMNAEPVVHLFVARTSRREEFREYLEKHGIGTAVHYPVVIPDMEAFKAFTPGNRSACGIARKRAGEILSLPVYPELTDEEVRYICRVIQEFP